MGSMSGSRIAKSLAPLAAAIALAGCVSFDSPPVGMDDERTCFQTGAPFSGVGDVGADVAIVYGIHHLPERIRGWRSHGYHIQMMTGSAWGAYQDYLYGKYDGSNHVDEVQTDRNGVLDSHGGNVFYMCPSTNFGNFLCRSIEPALNAGVEAIYLEEPEFWVKNGYSEGFKREWRNYYGEGWQPPDSSVNAAWKASKLKYFLYRRLLQQVFDRVQDFNRRTGRRVQCFVPTHSLLNYAQWGIVSPESSLARLNGCAGYIAQVWTGTARTPNMYHGKLKERTFETAFLEYGVMQNLVRSTRRTVWYLNDPVEDNPNHDWADYRRNWESTLTASLFQPEVWRYEVAPWPERVFGGRYPKRAPPDARKPIPPEYSTELQVVFNSLKNMKQDHVQWDCGTTGIGVLVSDSLMFERGEPSLSDPNLGNIYGMAMPLLMRGMPVTPVQLENVAIPHYLDPFHVLLLTYDGMKPLSPEPDQALADWVRRGGILIVCDDDADPYNKVHEWWNSNGLSDATPRQDLFHRLRIERQMERLGRSWRLARAGAGAVVWLPENPADMAARTNGDRQLIAVAKMATSLAKMDWVEKNYLMLRRGPYLIAAGLDDSIGVPPRVLRGHFINLFDATLSVLDKVTISPGARYYLLDLDRTNGSMPRVLASACRVNVLKRGATKLSAFVEGVSNTPAVVLIKAAKSPRRVTLGGRRLTSFNYSARDQLLRIYFTNEARQRKLTVVFK